MTRVLTADGPGIAEAVKLLRSGGVIVFPTDTVYGVGVDSGCREAIERIYEIKGRSRDKPLQLLLADPAEITQVAEELTPIAQRLAQAFLPGPLTLIVRRSARVLPEVTFGGETVAVRVPASPVVAALVVGLGHPIAATSANLSGRASPTTVQDVLQQLKGRVDLILDGGSTPFGRESTIVDTTQHPPGILREGAIGSTAIEAFLRGNLNSG